MFTLSSTDTLSGIAGIASAIIWTAFGDDVIAGADGFKVIGGPAFLTTSIASMIAAATGEQRVIGTLVLKNVMTLSVPVALYLNGTATFNQVEGLTIPANGKAVSSRSGVNLYDGTGALVGSSALTSAKNYSARAYARQNWR